jgi:hypothetical protein
MNKVYMIFGKKQYISIFIQIRLYYIIKSSPVYIMKLIHIFQRATDFGTFRSRDNFFSFALKCLFYIIPAIILGDYTDRIIKNSKTKRLLGDDTIYYILLQTTIIISTLYLILLFLSGYTSEFQLSLAGGVFIVLYFGIQTNYMDMIKDYIAAF